EARARLVSQLQYDISRDRLDIDGLRLETDALALGGRGTLDGVRGKRELVLDGRLGYDLARLEPFLKAILGPGVKAEGRGAHPFRLTGSLSSPAAMKAEAAVDWQRLEAFGFLAGPATL